MPTKLKLALAIAGYYVLVGVAWWRCGWWVAIWMGLASTLTAAIIYLLTEDDENSSRACRNSRSESPVRESK